MVPIDKITIDNLAAWNENLTIHFQKAEKHYHYEDNKTKYNIKRQWAVAKATLV